MIDLTLVEHIAAIGGAVVTAASAVCAMTKTPDPATPLGKLYRGIEIAALLVGKAKDAGVMPSDPAADKLAAGAEAAAAEILAAPAAPAAAAEPPKAP